MSSAAFSNFALATPGFSASAGVANINPWSLLPPLGNLDAYISAVNRLPMLTLEQEQTFARELFPNDDALGKRVTDAGGAQCVSRNQSLPERSSR